MDVGKYQERDLPTEAQVEEEARAVGAKTFNIVNISGREAKKCILMALMFFLINYVYALLRELKDTFILSRQLPASISFLKLFYVPPVSIFVSAVIARFLSLTSNQKMLSVVLISYAVYFVFYGLVISQFHKSLEPSPHFLGDTFAEQKMKFLGFEFFSTLFLTMTSWTSTLHFIMSEVWGSAVLVLLFLSFANDVCPFKQYLRFMPIMYIFSNIALMFSFGTVRIFEVINDRLSFRGRSWAITGLFMFFALVSTLTCLIGIYLQNSVLSKPIFIVETERKKKKMKVGFVEGFKLMFRSRLVLAICGMVLAYNIGTNLVEANYKSAVGIRARLTNQSEAATMSFLSYQQIIVGTIVVILLCTPFSRLIQVFGWTTMGLVAPITATFSFFAVFAFALINTSLAQENISIFNSLIGSKNVKPETMKKLAIYEVICGLIAVSAFKITKYAAFDIAKEALSMRINRKYRARFKGIYDGVCGKLGKAGGALISIFCNLFMDSTDIRSSSFFYSIVAALLTAMWFFFVLYLGRAYQVSMKNDCDVDIDLMGEKGSLDDDEEEIEQSAEQKKAVK